MLGSGKRKQAQEDLLAIAQDAKSLSEEIKSLQVVVKGQNALLLKQQLLLEGFTKEHHTSLADLAGLKQQYAKAVHDAEAEVHNLKSSRIELHAKVLETFNQRVSASLRKVEDSLAADTKVADGLSHDLKAARSEIVEAKAAIARLVEASNSVKDADLSLKEHALELKATDQERLRLLKRVDELESLLAKLKRDRPVRRRF